MLSIFYIHFLISLFDSHLYSNNIFFNSNRYMLEINRRENDLLLYVEFHRDYNEVCLLLGQFALPLCMWTNINAGERRCICHEKTIAFPYYLLHYYPLALSTKLDEKPIHVTIHGYNLTDNETRFKMLYAKQSIIKLNDDNGKYFMWDKPGTAFAGTKADVANFLGINVET